MRPLRSSLAFLLLLVAASSPAASAFTLPTSAPRRAVSFLSHQRVSASGITALGASPDDGDGEEKPIECYITNEEGVLLDGEKPEVICTSEPEEYAWMEGIDPKKMVKTDGVEDKMECVEGASPKGTPEWKCE